MWCFLLHDVIMIQHLVMVLDNLTVTGTLTFGGKVLEINDGGFDISNVGSIAFLTVLQIMAQIFRFLDSSNDIVIDDGSSVHIEFKDEHLQLTLDMDNHRHRFRIKVIKFNF